MVSEDKPYVGAEGKTPSRVAGGFRAPQLCCLPVRCCCCAQFEAVRTCSSPSNLLRCQPKTIELLRAGLGLDFTYNQKLFHPTEPDIGDIDPMPVLLIVSQDQVVRSWQLCNLSRCPTAIHACCTAFLSQ